MSASSTLLSRRRQREQNRLERKTIRCEQRKVEKERQFALRQQKKREKYRGH
ncbi:DUF2992 family protein [Evtepia sp.]|uniref:DUF2992 family protein n=1 Tax=Evtepia sp. TaxID=2773933 RepID=UPI00387EB53C